MSFPSDNRADKRARVHLPAELGLRDKSAVEMVDVSYRGVAVKLPKDARLPATGSLVKIGIALRHRLLDVHAVVVRLVPQRDGSWTVGLKLYAVSGVDKTDWNAFVARSIHLANRAA